MAAKTSFSYTLSPEQQQTLAQILETGNYRPVRVPYTTIAVDAEGCRVNLYSSGKCLIQGKGSENFVIFVMEPMVLKQAGVGYEEALDPDATTPHMGIDESGKGDFFGPLVVAAAYVNPDLAATMQSIGVRDSKRIKSDKQAMMLGSKIRNLLGPNRFKLISIGPPTYNRLYAKIRNVNRLLAWAHARAIENLLETVPSCPRAVSDQFGHKSSVERALMKKGRQIELIQRHKAESDIAVAAASILARDAFIRALARMTEQLGLEIPKGASPQVREAACELVRRNSPTVLLNVAKCHFRTTDLVLSACGSSRDDLPEEGRVTSRPKTETPAGRRTSTHDAA